MSQPPALTASLPHQSQQLHHHNNHSVAQPFVHPMLYHYYQSMYQQQQQQQISPNPPMPQSVCMPQSADPAADTSTSSSSGAATPISPQQQQQLITTSSVSCQKMPPPLAPIARAMNSAELVNTTNGPQINGGDGAAGGVRIELANRELWQKFHRVTNEMVVTRAGRKMFPKLELHLHGLDPKVPYYLTLNMRQVDPIRYKYQAGGWSPAGHDDSSPSETQGVYHHDGWNAGEYWMGQDKVCFDRVKLTNQELQHSSNSLISLCSMHKYQPVLRLYTGNERSQMELLCSFEPPETQFIAVTAYQSEAVTQLKVEHNPFAKGFREGSSRKRTLSPPPSEPNCSPPPAVPVPTKRPFLGPSTPVPAMVSSFPFYGFPTSPAVSAWHPSILSTFLASMAQQNNSIDLGKVYSQFWQQQQQQQQQMLLSNHNPSNNNNGKQVAGAEEGGGN